MLQVTRFDNLFCRDLGTGEYFGEQALLRSDVRTASVVALSAVECLTLDRE